jgi:hypothetical protein
MSKNFRKEIALRTHDSLHAKKKMLKFLLILLSVVAVQLRLDKFARDGRAFRRSSWGVRVPDLGCLLLLPTTGSARGRARMEIALTTLRQ